MLILKQTKIISFKNIKVAQIARAIKKVIKAKGKYSQKHKSTTIKANKLELGKIELKEPELKIAHITKKVINSKGKHG